MDLGMPNINLDKNCTDVTLHAFLGLACGSLLSKVPSLELSFESAACIGIVGASAVCLSEGLISIAKDFSQSRGEFMQSEKPHIA